MPNLEARPKQRGPFILTETQSNHSAATPERSDSDLLVAIAANRDENAFSILFRRYERAAYGLALQITGSHASAEEAAQEAFLRVWLRAETFRACEGKPRSWLLQIFARESLRIRRHNKAVSSVEKESARQALGDPSVHESEDASGEREELLAALHRGVSGLPKSTRQMVALYFGAGLSQEEIGKELEVSQTTVSMRIASAMNELRANLGKAGFAASLPMLESGALQDAILEGSQAPSALLSKIQGKLASAARVTGRVSRRVAASSVTGKVLAAVAALAVAASAGLYWASRTNPPAQTSPSDSPVPTGPSAASATPSVLVHKVWNFKAGAQSDMNVVKGEWRWEPASEKLPAGMLVPMHPLRETLVQLPQEAAHDRCWLVRIRGCFVENATGPSFQMIAAQNVLQPPSEYTRWRSVLRVPPSGHLESDTYFMDDWEINVYWNAGRTKIEGVFVFQHGPDTQRRTSLLASLSCCLVEEIMLSEVPREGIPEPFRDPERVIREFNLTPKHYVQRTLNQKSADQIGEMTER